MYPKARLDALGDAIFGVAMTLLVLDLRLPDDFHPHDATELLQAFGRLTPKVLPYVLSFGVLGLRWLSNTQARLQTESVSQTYAKWWLLYHLLITCVPFSTITVGRFANLAPAIWLYAANTLLLAAVALRIAALAPDERADAQKDRRLSLIVLIVSSLLAIALSFIAARQALWAFALNFVVPAIARSKHKRS